LFSAICSCLRRVVAHDYTSVTVYDEKRNAFDLWAIEFAGKGLIREHMFIPMEGSPAGAAFSAGRPMRFERAAREAMHSEVASMLIAEGVQSMYAIPLAVNERRLGVLGVGRLGIEPFTREDVEVLTAVATQVALSLENALAFQEIAALKDRIAAEK